MRPEVRMRGARNCAHTNDASAVQMPAPNTQNTMTRATW